MDEEYEASVNTTGVERPKPPHCHELYVFPPLLVVEINCWTLWELEVAATVSQETDVVVADVVATFDVDDVAEREKPFHRQEL